MTSTATGVIASHFLLQYVLICEMFVCMKTRLMSLDCVSFVPTCMLTFIIMKGVSDVWDRVTLCRLSSISGTWIKRDQLDVTCFIISLFNVRLVSDVNTSILRSLRLICWVISCVVLLWFDMCWCYVVVWLGWCGIRMQAEALVPQPTYGYHTTTAKPQRNTNTHRTRAIKPMK